MHKYTRKMTLTLRSGVFAMTVCEQFLGEAVHGCHTQKIRVFYCNLRPLDRFAMRLPFGKTLNQKDS